LLLVSDLAHREASEAADWYDEHAPGLGAEFVAAYERALQSIEAHPLRFPRWTQIRSSHEIRRRFLGKFPYSVIYAVRPRVIFVVAVAHFRRAPEYWVDRL
jgi:hypothetical protein